jgi:hypothetical protein
MAYYARDDAARLRDEVERLRQERDDALKKLQGVSTPIDPQGSSSWAADVAAAQEVSVQFDETRPNRLKLLLNENIRLPYFSALRVAWDWRPDVKESQPLYYWRSRPLPAVAEKDYDLPNDDPRLVTVKLLFYTTPEVRERLHVGDVIEKTITVLRTPLGLTVPPSAAGPGSTAWITTPARGASVDEKFSLGVTVTPAKDVSSDNDRMIHVLIRPLDGAPIWQDHYLILPLRLPLSEVARARPEQRHYATEVSLRGLLGSGAPDETPPTRFELLVVELPFRLRGWKLAKELLDPEKPGMKPLIKDTRQVTLKPSAGPNPKEAP